MRLRQILQIGVGVLLAVVITAYAGYQFHDFWEGPTITITYPQDGLAADSPVMEITGTVNRVAFLSLNGRQIYTNQQGEFSEQLLLSPGYNIITVSARDKFGRHTEKHLQIMLHNSPTDLLIYGQKQ